MSKRRWYVTPALVLGVVGLSGVLSGCMPNMTLEQIREMTPPRAAEMDQLQELVGTWEGTSTANFKCIEKGRDLKGSGTMATNWAGDKNFIVTNGAFEIEGMGKMHGLEIIQWNAKKKKFEVSWHDSHGSTGHGWLWRDESTGTWHNKAKGTSPWGKTAGKGTMRVTDANTMEWSWTEYMACPLTGLKMAKIGTMSGNSKKK